jgi:putative redox protein
MQSKVEWTGGHGMAGITAKGQRIEFDYEDGPGPMQITLQMVGACSLVDIIEGLRTRTFTKAWVEMDSTRADASPRFFTSMHLVYHVEGDIPKKLVERLVEKSHEKYCSVSNSLKESCKITTEVVIH